MCRTFAMFDKNGRFCWLFVHLNGSWKFDRWCTAGESARFVPAVHWLKEEEWFRYGHYVVYQPLTLDMDVDAFIKKGEKNALAA